MVGLLLKGLKNVGVVFALMVVLVPATGHLQEKQEAKRDSVLSYLPVGTGTPSIPEKYKVTSIEQLMPGTRYYVEHGMQIEKGESVLIVADSLVGDPLITEAWARAARERGAIVDVVTLALTPHRAQSETGPLGSDEGSWWPTWLEHAILKADATIILTALNVSHGINRMLVLEKWNRGRIGLPGSVYTREQLAFTKWTTYPAELDIALQKKLFEQISVDTGPKVIHITDPLGTDFTFTQDVDREWVREHFPTDLNMIEASLTHRSEYMFHHVKMAPGISKKPDGRGVIVANSMIKGPVALLKLRIEGGRIVSVEGNGPEADEWRQGIETYKGFDYGFPHGPGVNWVNAVYFGANPKVVRVDYFNPNYFKEQGSYNYWWSDSKRSGFMHIGFGPGSEGLRIDLPDWHSDVFIPFPTMTANGKRIVENGHLTALDDPEIRRIAAKYGDPDELLREEWVPEYDSDPSIKGYYTKQQYEAILRSFKRRP